MEKTGGEIDKKDRKRKERIEFDWTNGKERHIIHKGKNIQQPSFFCYKD